MEIQYLGANCVRIVSKGSQAIIDPAVPGLTVNTKKAAVSLVTNPAIVKVEENGFVIDTPGEYEISGLSIAGISAQGHMDTGDTRHSTIYKVMTSDGTAVITGHLFPKLDDVQLESLGMVDVLIIPVGGNGYTLDAQGAAQIIKKIEPKVVIPTHYADKAIKYEVPQNELSDFLDEVGAKDVEKQEKFKLNKNTILSEQLQVVVLDRVS